MSVLNINNVMFIFSTDINVKQCECSTYLYTKYKYVLHSNINSVCISWHFQKVIHNLQTTFSQLTDQKKVWDVANNTNRTFHK